MRSQQGQFPRPPPRACPIGGRHRWPYYAPPCTNSGPQSPQPRRNPGNSFKNRGSLFRGSSARPHGWQSLLYPPPILHPLHRLQKAVGPRRPSQQFAVGLQDARGHPEYRDTEDVEATHTTRLTVRAIRQRGGLALGPKPTWPPKFNRPGVDLVPTNFTYVI